MFILETKFYLFFFYTHSFNIRQSFVYFTHIVLILAKVVRFKSCFLHNKSFFLDYAFYMTKVF